MKIYIATKYQDRNHAFLLGGILKDLGYTVTSRWIQGLHDNVDPAICAKEDLEDIDNCDTLVHLVPIDRGGTGGRHVEVGYALARGKRVIIVGPREHVFHYLPQVECVPYEELFHTLQPVESTSLQA